MGAYSNIGSGGAGSGGDGCVLQLLRGSETWSSFQGVHFDVSRAFFFRILTLHSLFSAASSVCDSVISNYSTLACIVRHSG